MGWRPSSPPHPPWPDMARAVEQVLQELKHATDAERESVRRELEAHLEDHMEVLLDLGRTPEEAREQAEEALGDPVELGKALDSLYDPLWLWLDRLVLLLLAVALFVGASLGMGMLMELFEP